MKILLICSKKFYAHLPSIKASLEKAGHILTMPNCHDKPETEDIYRAMGREEHSKWKSGMIAHSEEVIRNMDAVVVLNYDKGELKNYIGGATFLEVYDAFRLGKKIFFYNELPDGILHDELVGFSPVILNADLTKIS